MYDELKTLIVQGNETISNRFEELEQRIADTETKAARPRATAGSTKGLSIEAKALATFFESGEGLSRKAISGATGAAGGFALPEEINQVVQDQLIDVSPKNLVRLGGRAAVHP